jgi:hypothetical protein
MKMKKHLTIAIPFLLFATVSHAQVKQQADEIKKDPQQKENAAKADRHVVNNKRMYDTVSIGKTADTTVNTKSPGKKKKKRSCDCINNEGAL